MHLLQERRTTTDAPAPRGDVAIWEARRLRRRRWSVGAVVMVAIAALVVGVVASVGGGPPRPRGSVATNSNPSHAATAGGNGAKGAIAASAYIPTTPGTTLLAHGRSVWLVDGGGESSPPCTYRSVNASTLAASGATTLPCDDPMFSGSSIAFTVVGAGNFVQDLRVAHRDPATGKIALGPVLTQFEWDSGSHPVVTYGPGVMWLYELEATHGPTVWRISDATGDVLQEARVTGLIRPLLVADADGLYLLGAGSFGANDGRLIFHVGIGSTHAMDVFSVSTHETGYSTTAWAVASGDRLWADICRQDSGSTCAIWGFGGPSLRPLFHIGDHGRGGQQAALGPGGIYVLDRDLPSEGTGMWDVTRVDPNDGAMTTVATFGLSATFDDEVYSPGINVIDGDAMYVLDTALGRLHRIPLGS
jgi:hypothetical protein